MERKNELSWKRASGGTSIMISVRVQGICSLVLAFMLMCLASSSALGLSGGRVYELVSPAYKGGYGVHSIRAAALDGERVMFTSQGSFGDVPSNKYEFSYLARRGLSGWSTIPLEAPSTLSPDGGTSDISVSFESSLFFGLLGTNTFAAQELSSEGAFLAHAVTAPDTAAEWEIAGGLLLRRADGKLLVFNEVGASSDLCHIILEADGPLLGLAVGTSETLYELVRQCGGESSLRLVALNNNDEPINSSCAAELGAGVFKGGEILSINKTNEFNAISSNGNEIFFTTKAPGACSHETGQVFVRLNGLRTLEVSKPLETCPGEEVPCPATPTNGLSVFEGASADGSKVFFTTARSLVTEDKDKENDLYMASIGCPTVEGEGCEVAKKQVTSVVRVSHASAGEAAKVQGVVRVAPDGSRVYFVAQGVLSGGANAEGKLPVKGAENLYVYDTVLGGAPAFVADLCSGPGESGSVADSSCPSDLEAATVGRNDRQLWLGPRQEAQSSGDGRFLVFGTYAKLLKSDTDNAEDIYRYDAVSGTLERVSFGEAGADANGNGAEGVLDDATISPAHVGEEAEAYLQNEMGGRALSEDGSWVVFTTAEPLSPRAVNSLPNIYVWHRGAGEGAVTLVSSGNALTPDVSPDISPSGNDVFFMTSQGLVPQDTDGLLDIYDARLGGGFEPVPEQLHKCSGDACQGPLTNPVPLLVPGSAEQSAGENFGTQRQATSKKSTAKKKVSKAKRRGTSRTRRGSRRAAHARRGRRAAIRGRGA